MSRRSAPPLGSVPAVRKVALGLGAAGLLGAGALLAAPALTPDGLRAPPGVGREAPAQELMTEYDGRFSFTRIRFGDDRRGIRNGFFGRDRRRAREAPWEHDRPRGADRNIAKILQETTFVPTVQGQGNVLELEDPELFDHPVIYIVEVGYWEPSDEAVANLREFLLKGGFMIVDDFTGSALRNFDFQMRRVLPEARMQEIPDDHPVFDSFFHIANPRELIPPYNRRVPTYLGIFEDGDPYGQLMVAINYNQDIGEYWEYSDRGYYPIDLTNEAYKFGVNYVIYGLTR